MARYGKSAVCIIMAVAAVLLLSSCLEENKGAKEGLSGKAASAEKEWVPVAQGPRIEFDSPVYDFGEVGLYEESSGTFVFRNIGNSTLDIGEIKSTSGLIEAKIGNMSYAPGEYGVISVHFYGLKFPQSIEKAVYVSTNDPENPKVELMVKAEAVVLLEGEPEQIDLLPLAENAGMPPIHIKTRQGEPFAIKEITSTCGCIEADFDGNDLSPEFVVQTRVDVSKLKEGQQGQIKIRTGYDRWPYSVLYYKVWGKFRTEPGTVSFSDAKEGVPLMTEASVINNYGNDFEIESIQSVRGYTEVLKKERIPHGWRLELKITPPPIKDSLSFSDIINVKVKDSETVIVYCLGQYSRAKEILEELNKKRRPMR